MGSPSQSLRNDIVSPVTGAGAARGSRIAGELRGRGLIAALELVSARESRAPFPAAAGAGAFFCAAARHTPQPPHPKKTRRFVRNSDSPPDVAPTACRAEPRGGVKRLRRAAGVKRLRCAPRE